VGTIPIFPAANSADPGNRHRRAGQANTGSIAPFDNIRNHLGTEWPAHNPSPNNAVDVRTNAPRATSAGVRRSPPGGPASVDRRADATQ